MTAHDSGWKWWLAFSFLPDSHRLHWHQLAWRTQRMTQYARIENGQVAEGPRALPRTTAMFSGLHLLSDVDLKRRGWLPVRDVGKQHDRNTEELLDLAPGDLAVAGDEVVATWRKRTKTAEELKADARGRLAGSPDDASMALAGLIEALLVKGTVEAADLGTEAAAAWQRIKGDADTVRG